MHERRSARWIWQIWDTSFYRAIGSVPWKRRTRKTHGSDGVCALVGRSTAVWYDLDVVNARSVLVVASKAAASASPAMVVLGLKVTENRGKDG